ncbi:MAG: VOC family protein [Pseudomonadota bacterium]
MATYVEHMQLLVSDISRTEKFYTTIFPDWSVRGQGREVGGSKKYEWIHIGTPSTYLSFRTHYEGQIEEQAKAERVSNHIGIVVDDIEMIISTLKQIGGEVILSKHPHRVRVYTRDPDGYEIEIIQYLSDKDSEKNDYQWCLANGVTVPCNSFSQNA